MSEKTFETYHFPIEIVSQILEYTDVRKNFEVCSKSRELWKIFISSSDTSIKKNVIEKTETSSFFKNNSEFSLISVILMYIYRKIPESEKLIIQYLQDDNYSFLFKGYSRTKKEDMLLVKEIVKPILDLPIKKNNSRYNKIVNALAYLKNIFLKNNKILFSKKKEKSIYLDWKKKRLPISERIKLYPQHQQLEQIAYFITTEIASNFSKSTSISRIIFEKKFFRTQTTNRGVLFKNSIEIDDAELLSNLINSTFPRGRIFQKFIMKRIVKKKSKYCFNISNSNVMKYLLASCYITPSELLIENTPKIDYCLVDMILACYDDVESHGCCLDYLFNYESIDEKILNLLIENMIAFGRNNTFDSIFEFRKNRIFKITKSFFDYWMNKIDDKTKELPNFIEYIFNHRSSDTGIIEYVTFYFIDEYVKCINSIIPSKRDLFFKKCVKICIDICVETNKFSFLEKIFSRINSKLEKDHIYKLIDTHNYTHKLIELQNENKLYHFIKTIHKFGSKKQKKKLFKYDACHYYPFFKYSQKYDSSFLDIYDPVELDTYIFTSLANKIENVDDTSDIVKLLAKLVIPDLDVEKNKSEIDFSTENFTKGMRLFLHPKYSASGFEFDKRYTYLIHNELKMKEVKINKNIKIENRKKILETVLTEKNIMKRNTYYFLKLFTLEEIKNEYSALVKKITNNKNSEKKFHVYISEFAPYIENPEIEILEKIIQENFSVSETFIFSLMKNIPKEYIIKYSNIFISKKIIRYVPEIENCSLEDIIDYSTKVTVNSIKDIFFYVHHYTFYKYKNVKFFLDDISNIKNIIKESSVCCVYDFFNFYCDNENIIICDKYYELLFEKYHNLLSNKKCIYNFLEELFDKRKYRLFLKVAKLYEPQIDLSRKNNKFLKLSLNNHLVEISGYLISVEKVKEKMKEKMKEIKGIDKLIDVMTF